MSCARVSTPSAMDRASLRHIGLMPSPERSSKSIRQAKRMISDVRSGHIARRGIGADPREDGQALGWSGPFGYPM